ncbi:EAL domain-containing protein [Pseudoalteromonas sp.]|uniref:EAL domain-containing protein n=1 Tax=Pseudoalteromonas sp. TaxID=53249 RepID=UPI003568A569
MQQGKLKFFNRFKALYLVLLLLVLFSANSGLSHRLEQQTLQSGQQLTEQLYQLQLTTQQDSPSVTKLLAAQNFSLSAVNLPFYLTPFVAMQQHMFSYETINVTLYYWPLWVQRSELFILLNLIILVLAYGLARYWQPVCKAMTLSPHTQPELATLLGTVNSGVTDEVTQYKQAATGHYDIFALIAYPTQGVVSAEFEVCFKRHLARAFPALAYISIKVLNATNATVTLRHIPATELEQYIERLQQNAATVYNSVVGHTSQQDVKIGLCNYRAGADQMLVYQLAKSALALSQQSLILSCHRLALTPSQVTTLSNSQLIDSIKANKFMIFFQPLVALNSGHILQHEVLVKIRGAGNDLLLANYGISQLHNSEDALLFDQAIIMKLKTLLLTDPASAVISINLHPKNWFNDVFWHWLPAHVGKLTAAHKLQFGINKADFFNYQQRLTVPLSIMSQFNYQIIIDDVQSSEHILQLAHYPQVAGIKLAYDLVHAIARRPLQQRYVKKIVNAANLANLAVFASGVETEQELQLLTRLGVNAAQGGYFSQLLPDFTLS